VFFPSLANDRHIVGPTSDVVPTFLRLYQELSTLRFSMQAAKCVAWSPKGLDNFISFPPSFLTPDSSFYILGTPIRSISFVESFVVEAFHENFGMISSLLMFAIFLLCCAQHSSYLLCTMFPSLGILQHYVEFGACTIATLEKLLGVGSLVILSII
jgi:hypothetical protein